MLISSHIGPVSGLPGGGNYGRYQGVEVRNETTGDWELFRGPSGANRNAGYGEQWRVDPGPTGYVPNVTVFRSFSSQLPQAHYTPDRTAGVSFYSPPTTYDGRYCSPPPVIAEATCTVNNVTTTRDKTTTTARVSNPTSSSKDITGLTITINGTTQAINPILPGSVGANGREDYSYTFNPADDYGLEIDSRHSLRWTVVSEGGVSSSTCDADLTVQALFAS